MLNRPKDVMWAMAGPVGFEPTILGSEGPRLGPGSTTGPRNSEKVYAS